MNQLSYTVVSSSHKENSFLCLFLSAWQIQSFHKVQTFPGLCARSVLEIRAFCKHWVRLIRALARPQLLPLFCLKGVGFSPTLRGNVTGSLSQRVEHVFSDFTPSGLQNKRPLWLFPAAVSGLGLGWVFCLFVFLLVHCAERPSHGDTQHQCVEKWQTGTSLNKLPAHWNLMAEAVVCRCQPEILHVHKIFSACQRAAELDIKYRYAMSKLCTSSHTWKLLTRWHTSLSVE